MGNKLPDADGFVTVPKKKSGKAKKLHRNTSPSDVLDVENCRKSIEKAKLDLTSSVFYTTFISLVKEISFQVNRTIKDIVCLGIGTISSCKTAQYQLALLLAVQEEIGCSVEVYDPIFSQADKDILSNLKLKISSSNTEGKVIINPKSFTLFVLPHCPKELINNLLFSNWSPEKLENCVIYGNSLETLKLNTPKRFLEPFHYITQSESIIEELEVPNNFRFSDIFNDLSLHLFPVRLLSGVNSSFWENPEPVYQSGSELIKENGRPNDAEGLDS